MNALSPTLMLPLLWRRAMIKEGSLDRIDNYVEVVLDPALARQQSAEAAPFDEDLAFNETALRTDAIDRRADPPDRFDTLAAFWPYGCDIVAGRAEIAIKLTRSDRFAKTVRKCIEGDTRSLWIGYRAHRVEIEDRPGDVPLYRITEWEPVEVATTRRETSANNMAIVTRVAPPKKDDEMDPTIRTRAIAALAKKGLPPTPSMIETITRAEASAARQRATAMIDDAIAQGRGENRVIGPANAEARAAAITSALLHRSDPEKHPLTAGGQHFRGMSLLAIARDSLEVAGIRTDGLDRHELATAALTGATRAGGLATTSDFPSILSNIAHKTLREAYQAAPQTFRPLVQETSVPDFQPVSRQQLGEAPKFERTGEHGEFRRGQLGDSAETYSIATFGRIVGITRQVIINDDTDAFTRVPAAFGVQAANLEGDLVWAAILGPRPMADGLPVFHASHRNVGVPVTLGTVGLGAARAKMRTLVGLDGATLLNIRPTYLIVPGSLEMAADQLLATITPARADDAVPQAVRSLKAITETRLDLGFTDPDSGSYIAPSNTAWYLAASPGSVDTVELAYLDGQKGIYTEVRNGFDVDGIEIKARLDLAAKAIDWRGFYRNAGAPA